MPTTVISNTHYYAFCHDCPFAGPLRFTRDLAETDAAKHAAEKHPAEPPTETPPADRGHPKTAGEVIGARRAGGAR